MSKFESSIKSFMLLILTLWIVGVGFTIWVIIKLLQFFGVI